MLQLHKYSIWNPVSQSQGLGQYFTYTLELFWVSKTQRIVFPFMPSCLLNWLHLILQAVRTHAFPMPFSIVVLLLISILCWETCSIAQLFKANFINQDFIYIIFTNYTFLVITEKQITSTYYCFPLYSPVFNAAYTVTARKGSLKHFTTLYT